MAPDHADPHHSQALPEWAVSVPFETDLHRVFTEYTPDVALVTLPNVDAPAAIAACANAGVHVLVDKPSARTASEAECAFGAARLAGIKAAVALARRYGRGWQEVNALIASGRLGRLLTTEAVVATSSVAAREPSNLIFRKREMGGRRVALARRS
jgi:predicted dehydrogenase